MAQHSLAEHIRAEAIKNFFINVIINAGIAYALLGDQEQLTAWGEHGYGPDALLTAALLTGILSGIFIPMYRAKLRRGEWPQIDNFMGKFLPYSAWLCAPLLGLIAVLTAAPLLVLLLKALGLAQLSGLHYAVIKGLWAGALSAIVVPVAIHQGLRPGTQ